MFSKIRQDFTINRFLLRQINKFSGSKLDFGNNNNSIHKQLYPQYINNC